MGQTVLMDSCVWAANFLERDTFHATADRLITRTLSNGALILVPEIARAEVLNVVLHRSLDIVMEPVTDAIELAEARIQREQFDRNAAWPQAHIAEEKVTRIYADQWRMVSCCEIVTPTKSSSGETRSGIDRAHQSDHELLQAFGSRL